MPGIDHLRIGGNCFSLEKDLLLFNLNPGQLCYLLTFLHHLREGKKNKIKCGVQVKHSRDFVCFAQMLSLTSILEYTMYTN